MHPTSNMLTTSTFRKKNSYIVRFSWKGFFVTEKGPNTKKGRSFTEGWVEFSDKRKAKMVALKLNNTTIGGKKKSRWYDELWNIKYLHR